MTTLLLAFRCIEGIILLAISSMGIMEGCFLYNQPSETAML